MSKVKIAIVDDERIFRELLVQYFQKIGEYDVVIEAKNGEDLLCSLESVRPDVVILDIMMPDCNGVTAAEQLIKLNSKMKIIILSSYKELRVLRQLIRIGISGYLVKTCGLEELKQAVDQVNLGEMYFCRQIGSLLFKDYTRLIKDEKINDIELTIREKEILQLIAEGNVIKDISDKLNISKRTVETHKKNLMAKLGISNNAGLFKYAIQNDYVWFNKN